MSLASARSTRRLVTTVALAAGVGLVAGCFDSDEKYQPMAGSTSTTGPISTTSSSTSTSSSSSTTAEPDVTCRDAIECVLGCINQLQASMLPEPDLTCFLECEPGLNSDQVLDLFHLAECATNVCIASEPACEFLVPTETSTGGSSSSDGGSSSSGTDTGTGSSSTTGENPTAICLDCVVAYLLDENPGGECQAVADECQ